MQANQDTLQAISAALSATSSPDGSTRRAAEDQLRQAESQPGFLLVVLDLVRTPTLDKVVRQTAGIYFKNAVKRLWSSEEDQHISEEDKAAIKTQLIPLMISLATPQTSLLQKQIGEGLTVVAEHDFPDQWAGLIDELVNSLTPDDFVINNGVLATAHSIFRRWRSQMKSDSLYSEINFVLSRFCEPYTKLFIHVDQLLSQPSPPQSPTATLPILAEAVQSLLELFRDLTSQDLPPYFEDNIAVYMGNSSTGEQGLLLKYLSWNPAELQGDSDDEQPGVLQNIRASICETAELFTQRYLDAFPGLDSFIQGAWGMLADLGPGTREDVLASRALRFLSVVAKRQDQKEKLSTPGTLDLFCEKIILPNMSIREHEEEMFEDNPIEYIHRDLEPTSESDTRRQAATEFTQALMEQFDQEITTIIKGFITGLLTDYASDPSGKWKSKDTAIYLLTSIAARGSTAHAGVTSTNTLVNVVDFFGQNVFSDLSAAPGSVNPILVVDAIKFLYTFRSQLTKEQLLSVLPILVQHLESPNYVIYSYAAITIERILFIKVNKQALFDQADVRPFAENILMALFTNIEKGGTPETIAENDYLMKCAMRVIITARQTLTPVYEAILNRLVNILGEISKNPSNPKFNQYCFESVSALIRFVCDGYPPALLVFENAIFGPAQVILAQDVVEFIPYIFQILAQLLELHPATELPEAYQMLLAPLLTAQLWEQRGNVPALVRIWKALLLRGAPTIAANDQVGGLLGIFHRLIGSKINEGYAFEILQSLYEFMPLEVMKQFTTNVFMILLNRLQSKASPHSYPLFTYFVCFLSAIDNVGPDYVISAIESVQAGLFGNLLSEVVLGNTQKAPPRQRKVIAVGLTKFLSRSDLILIEPSVQQWHAIFLALLDLFTLPQDLTYTNTTDISELDHEDAGFQSSFSKLGASEKSQRDPVKDVGDEKAFASKELGRRSKEKPQVIEKLIQRASEVGATEAKTVDGFVQFMGTNGDALV